MSEPKLVSPLLDNFVMGDPISQHHGVRSCPAMQKDSDSKYIVKIVSIPASQRNLDALLLTGAFPDAQAAQAYFKELADGVENEAKILQQLSKLEGFLSYRGWQIVPMEKDTGYNVYLLGDYRRSLERHFRREPMTHLAAVNLGLDLCAALSVCRRCGYLYINLKPSNIFIGEDQDYRIGDLGFTSLDSLKHASVPDRYRSAYTPPEIADAFSSLNTTVDTYAVGLILYQAYNNGQLPFEGMAPAEMLQPPLYADYEMSEIILKACDPNPENRWEDPLEMGKAIVSYMQRNSINDVPIVPVHATQESVPAEDLNEELPDDDYLAQAQENDGIPLEIDPWLEDEPEQLSFVSEDALTEQADPDVAEVPISEDDEMEAPAEADSDEPGEASVASEEAGEAEEISVEQEDFLPDETLPSEESAEGLEDASLTEEVSSMLALADELIAHELPDPVVVPEPVPISIPEPLPLEEAEAEDPETQEAPQVDEIAETQENPEAESLAEEASEDVEEDEEESDKWVSEDTAPVRSRPPRSYKKLIIFLLIVALSLSLFTGGYAFYKFYYLQTIDKISLVNSDEQVTVKLTSSIDDDLLTVVCKDTYGNTQRKSVVNGIAVFDSLNPGTSYDFFVEISGLHALVGKTKASLTTSQQTSILNLAVVAGSEDGSAIVSFTVQGPDTSWQVVCSAEGEDEKTFPCVDHSANLQGLTPGVTYNIKLVPTSSLYVSGEDSTTYTATKIVYAQDLKATAFQDNKLTIAWTIPEGTVVESWTVRCYDNETVDKTLTVQETTAVFEGLDSSKPYNIEVTAAGMTRSVTAHVSANIVSLQDLKVVALDKNYLRVTWNYAGNAPVGGWRVLYYINGGTDPLLVNCESASATLPLVPNGHYEITVIQANGNTVLDGTTSYDAPAAETFANFRLTADSLNFYPCLPTDATVLTFDSVTKTNTFAPGAKASLLMQTQQIYHESYEEVINLYVIKDSKGAVVSVTNPVRIWADMLERGFGLINLPAVPSATGSYTVEIYFDGAFVGSVPFTVE